MISLKELAKIAGVDVSTISRALNDSPRVKPETKDRIRKLANQYNYIPDEVARGLVGKRTNTVGIIIPEFSNTFYSEIIEGLEGVFNQDGFSMLFGKSNYKTENENRIIDLFMRKRVDGIIACSISENSLHDFRKNKVNIPLVLVDSFSNTSEFDSVSIDNAYGVECVINYLVGLGHRSIGFIGNNIVTTDRYKSYESTLIRHSIDIQKEFVRIGDERNEKGGYLRMMELLSLARKPTAVFAVSDSMAIGAIHAIKASGLKVPEDISVVGFDDIMVSSYIDTALTTVQQPKYDIGRISAELLVKRIKSGMNKFNQNIIIKPELIVRNTTKSPTCIE